MKWVVNAKLGSPLCEPATFEICVLRDDNTLGKESYGWFGENKLLISHNGGPCRWPLTQKVLTKLLAIASEVADELNQEEASTESVKI